MLVYAVYLISVVIFGILLKKRTISRREFLLISYLFLVFIQTFRDPTVGIDVGKTSGYIEFFNNVTKFNPFGPKVYDFERGYIIYNYILAMLTNNNEIIFLMVTSLFIHGPFFILIFKQSKDVLLSVLFYLSLDYFIFSFSGLRQAMALSLVIVAYLYLCEKKNREFIVFVVLASFFHKSAIITLIMPFLDRIKFKKTSLLYLLSIAIITYVLSANIYSFLYYILNKEKWYPITTGAYRNMIYIGVIWFSAFLLNQLNKNKEENAVLLNLESNMLYIALIIQLFSNNSYTINRLGFYFLFPSIISITRIVSYIKSKSSRIGKLFYISLVFFLILIIVINLKSGYLDVYPYKIRRLK